MGLSRILLSFTAQLGNKKNSRLSLENLGIFPTSDPHQKLEKHASNYNHQIGPQDCLTMLYRLMTLYGVQNNNDLVMIKKKLGGTFQSRLRFRRLI